MDERSLHEERGQAGPILASELSNRFPVAKPSRTAFDRLWDIQIRRSIDDVDPFWALVSDSAYDKELKKVKPATFSYARDFASDADIWTARGVVARPFLIGKNETLALVPSVSFDRVDNGVDPKKDLDSLVFRLSGDYAAVLYAGKEDSFTAFFRARAAYKTNFGFDENKMLAGEFEWEPVPSALGFGTFKNHIPGFVRFRPRVFLHAEAGSAQSERAELSEDEKDFLRCGPAAVLEIAPDARDESWTSFNERLLLTLKYNYYWSAKADTDFENFTARLDWTLDSKGHFKAALEFQDGSLELETQSVQIFTVGLGVAF